jgi:hypothetical protein
MSDVRESMRRELERHERARFREQADLWRRQGLGPAYNDLRSGLYRGLGYAPRIPYRVERVFYAVDASGGIALQRLAVALDGIDLLKVGPILVQMCEDVALIVGGGALVGGALGGLAGGFAGGVGAIPGAGIGAMMGAQAGVWLLGFLGLASLAKELLDAVPHAFREYAWGVRLAWGRDDDPRDVLARGDREHIAAGAFATGHLLLLGAVLEAILAYVGRGRAESGALLAEIRASRRLGPAVADWIEANQAALKTKVERLRPPRAVAMESPRPPASGKNAITTEQLRREASDGAEPPRKPPDDDRPRRDDGPGRMPRHEVPCFNANRLPPEKIPEFDRQLANQEKALNELTVDEYLKGREAYERVGRSAKAASEAAKLRAEETFNLFRNFRESLIEQGLSQESAEVAAREAAKRTMDTLDALHDPDLVGGGRNAVAGLGDRSVNRSIGAQWPKGGRLVGRDGVTGLDDVARAVAEPLRGTTKMNASLRRCA